MELTDSFQFIWKMLYLFSNMLPACVCLTWGGFPGWTELGYAEGWCPVPSCSSAQPPLGCESEFPGCSWRWHGGGITWEEGRKEKTAEGERAGEEEEEDGTFIHFVWKCKCNLWFRKMKPEGMDFFPLGGSRIAVNTALTCHLWSWYCQPTSCLFIEAWSNISIHLKSCRKSSATASLAAF